MTAKTVNKLAAPGATLHYEVTGAGHVLLLIAGGYADCGVFDGIVGQLAADYTVVSYDPRGNSRSPYAGPPVDERVDRAADDALALLDEVAGDEPAYVFGSGTGAIAGLDLIVRHPERVRMLVAHEPPCVEVLPDAETPRAFFEDVHATCAADGVETAQRLYEIGTGLDEEDLPAPEDLRPEFREVIARMDANAAIYFTHKLLPFTRYQPDLLALERAAHRIVPAAGVDASAHLLAQPISVVADHLGWPVVSFPGGHAGYASHPVRFATLLARVLEAEIS